MYPAVSQGRVLHTSTHFFQWKHKNTQHTLRTPAGFEIRSQKPLAGTQFWSLAWKHVQKGILCMWRNEIRCLKSGCLFRCLVSLLGSQGRRGCCATGTTLHTHKHPFLNLAAQSSRAITLHCFPPPHEEVKTFTPTRSKRSSDLPDAKAKRGASLSKTPLLGWM